MCGLQNVKIQLPAYLPCRTGGGGGGGGSVCWLVPCPAKLVVPCPLSDPGLPGTAAGGGCLCVCVCVCIWVFEYVSVTMFFWVFCVCVCV